MHKHIIVHHELGIHLVIYSDNAELNITDALNEMIAEKLAEHLVQ